MTALQRVSEFASLDAKLQEELIKRIEGADLHVLYLELSLLTRELRDQDRALSARYTLRRLVDSLFPTSRLVRLQLLQNAEFIVLRGKNDLEGYLARIDVSPTGDWAGGVGLRDHRRPLPK